MLTYDPIPWLMAQEGLPAVRARRCLALTRPGDGRAVRALKREFAGEQLADGSFEHSPIKTVCVLNLLGELRAADSQDLTAGGAVYLLSVIESQPGYEWAKGVATGSLTTPCDLCGFFGPYEDRGRPEIRSEGAREMNFLREYEPLLGPRSPVRGERSSSYDRGGPNSCYCWGLIPLSYTIEALCRAGYAHDERLRPALSALLGAQRESGGWCRNLDGHANCSLPATRALGAHPELREGEYGQRALGFWRQVQCGERGNTLSRWWSGTNLFASLQAIAAFDLPVAHEIIRQALTTLAGRQRKNGTFGPPYRVERVAAVLAAARAVGWS